MPEREDFLVEIGTEELPPATLSQLAEAFRDNLVEELGQLSLAVERDQVRALAAPRRLALQVTDLPVVQPDREEQRLGPAVAAAFDADGVATRAARGFAGSCGVPVEALTRLETDKGERLAWVHRVEGQPAQDLLLGAVERALAGLPVARPMRWDDHDFAFVRPVHWVVMLLGEEVIPGTLLGQRAGRESRGHRFHHPGPVTLRQAADYEGALEEAFVIVDGRRRRERIRAAVAAAAEASGGRAVIREALLDEVANLVEWPMAVLGTFEPQFLEVPAEALVSSMESHQKFFPVVDGEGRLIPAFVGVANIESRDPAGVAAGYGRVIRPRLADARFFWDRDRARPLAAHRASLETMIYQQKLGSLGDKATRVGALAGTIAGRLGVPEDVVGRAAELAKCDLLTEMVGEFPELQGIMGRYLALEQGEPEAVAWAIEEHYLPRFAGDALPARPASQVLAIADRLDTLAGIFAAGLKPSGSRDPFALRRAALGVGRLIIEGELDLDLAELLEQALAGVEDRLPDARAEHEAVLDFVFERLRGWYADRGIETEVFNAVLAVRPTRLSDFHHRLEACAEFARLPAAEALAAANKRIGNILRKAGAPVTGAIDPGLLTDPAERDLAAAVAQARSAVEPGLARREYAAALRRLAELRDVVDRFFDEVLVMTEDAAVRDNRLRVLAGLKGLFDAIADISLLARAR